MMWISRRDTSPCGSSLFVHACVPSFLESSLSNISHNPNLCLAFEGFHTPPLSSRCYWSKLEVYLILKTPFGWHQFGVMLVVVRRFLTWPRWIYLAAPGSSTKPIGDNPNWLVRAQVSHFFDHLHNAILLPELVRFQLQAWRSTPCVGSVGLAIVPSCKLCPLNHSSPLEHFNNDNYTRLNLPTNNRLHPRIDRRKSWYHFFFPPKFLLRPLDRQES